MADAKNPNADEPQIGDKVRVRYLTGAPVSGTIVKEFTINASRAAELKKYYPDIKAGDKGYAVDDGSGDTRSFLRHEMEIVSHAKAPKPK